MNKEIEILEKMLKRMEEGTLGCSGFNIVETDAFRFAIKKLKEIAPKEDLLKCVICNKPTKKEDWGFQSSISNDEGIATNIITCKTCMKKDLNTRNPKSVVKEK